MDPAGSFARIPVWTMRDGARDLVQAALDDREAFAGIVERHKAMVYSVAYSYCRNPALAEDLAQEAFLDLYRHLPSIESDAHLTPWLRRAIVHRCIDHARWTKHHRHAALADVPEPRTEPRAPDPYLADAVRSRVRSLPASKRAVVILRFQEEMELAEIAEVLDIPVNTVKSRLHRALAVLKHKLSGWEGARHYGTARRGT
jgi:RNA polymerase sigma-70 factor (ECF subfamily)